MKQYEHIGLVQKFSLAKLISLGKILFNRFSHDFEPATSEAFYELKLKSGIIKNAGYFFYGEINVTTSEYCYYYLNGICPAQSRGGLKICRNFNTPCKKFKYDNDRN